MPTCYENPIRGPRSGHSGDRGHDVPTSRACPHKRRGEREHAGCATAGLGPLARETANHRRENYLQTQHSTRPALEPPPVEATSLGTQPASLRCALASRGRTVLREVLPAHHRIFIQGGGRAAGHGVSSVDHRIATHGSCHLHDRPAHDITVGTTLHLSARVAPRTDPDG